MNLEVFPSPQGFSNFVLFDNLFKSIEKFEQFKRKLFNQLLKLVL
jgi:hypothetical protein